jgi:hypothetical protein
MRYLLTFLFLNPLISFSQKIGDGVVNIYNSVGLITHPGGSGTGTLLYKIYPNEGVKIFLITCRHVLPATPATAKKIDFAIHNDSSKSGVSTLTIDIFDTLKRYSKYVRFDPLGNDIAVIDITGIFLAFPLKNLQNKPIPYTLLATRDSLYEYNTHVGDEVLFAGYPNYYHNSKNKKPLMRGAIIATPPEDIFYFDSLLIKAYRMASTVLPEKFDGFLIDGNAVAGSSGSLVFLRPQWVRNFHGILQQNITTSDPMVLGILGTSYFGTNPDDNRRINLGGVISADAIKRTIDLFTPN